MDQGDTTTPYATTSVITAEPTTTTTTVLSNSNNSNNNCLKSWICCNQCFSLSAIGILSCVCGWMFIQLQALTVKVALDHNEIQQLKGNVDTQQVQTNELQDAVVQEHDLTIVHIAGTFVLFTLLITAFHFIQHIRNFHEPTVQRKILAILCMPPIYAITSFLSLMFPIAYEYLAIIRDFYEAYCIYSFLSFLIAVLGRDGGGNHDRMTVVNVLSKHANHLDRPYKCLYCFFHPNPNESNYAMANAVLLECQILAMQFVFTRPITSILNFIFDSLNEFNNNNTSSSNGSNAGADDGSSSSSEVVTTEEVTTTAYSFFTSPQFIIAMINNISIFFAFAGLLKFYHAVRDDLRWCNPFPKFATIKGVVFMTFWQGLIIAIAFNLHTTSKGNSSSSTNNDDKNDHDDDPTEQARAIQQVLICLEMLLFSVVHWCVFPTEEWEPGYRPQKLKSLGIGIGFKDFAKDVNTIVQSSKTKRETRIKKNKYGLQPITQSDLDDDDDNDNNNDEYTYDQYDNDHDDDGEYEQYDYKDNHNNNDIEESTTTTALSSYHDNNVLTMNNTNNTLMPNVEEEPYETFNNDEDKII